MLASRLIETPLGPMLAAANERGLALCEFADRPMLPTQIERVQLELHEEIANAPHWFLDQTERELKEYFNAERETFTVPLVIDGSAFQMAVWRELLKIPFGRTTSYGEMAMRVGRPDGARAVGRANGDNRIAIIIPCHRVINADGTLSGYGGGKRRKQWLLRHEQRGLQLSFDGVAE